MRASVRTRHPTCCAGSGVRCWLAAARALGMAVADDAYAPEIYRAVYERLLARRHVEALAMDERLPTTSMSAYEFLIQTIDLVPNDQETARFIAEAERDFADPAVLERAIAGWFEP
jgi:hypothetical protein